MPQQSQPSVLFQADEAVAVKPVPAVMRAAAILDHIAASERPLSISDIARQLGLPKSSVHGLCHTLCGLNLLRLLDEGKFAIGPHVMQWTNAYLAENNLVDEFHHLLADDKTLDNFTITLSSLHGGDVIYMACRNSPAPLGVTFRIGMKLPAVFSATGKAMLARLDEAQLQTHLALPWPLALTRHSIGSPQLLHEELVQIRQQGYSVDDGQVREGMFCLGAAICNARGGVEAGIALSMTKAEAQPDVIEKVASGVMAIARHLSERFGTAM